MPRVFWHSESLALSTKRLDNILGSVRGDSAWTPELPRFCFSNSEYLSKENIDLLAFIRLTLIFCPLCQIQKSCRIFYSKISPNLVLSYRYPFSSLRYLTLKGGFHSAIIIPTLCLKANTVFMATKKNDLLWLSTDW